MRVKLLGSAAGGGFPQWNCACRNCLSLRRGTFRGKARSQLQVAVSEDNQTWFLLNASPDVRSQIEADPALHPNRGTRNTPIAGVVLSSADLDHVLGLLVMREFQRFGVYTTRSLQRVLREDNSMFAVLNRIPDQVEWVDVSPGRAFVLQARDETTKLWCTPVPLRVHFPSYLPDEHRRRTGRLCADEMSLGVLIHGASARQLAYFPTVPVIDGALLAQLSTADVVLFDGTFWSDDELRQVRQTGPTAREIGHLPIAGVGGSLDLLEGLKCARKVYVHVNNTNPILDEASPEYRLVREAGWEVAEDGWQFEL